MISTLLIDTLTIGEISSGHVIGDHQGFAYPDADVEVKGRGSQHGSSLGQYRYGARGLGIEGQTFGSTRTELETRRRSLIQAVGLHDGLKTCVVTLYSGLQLQFEAIVRASFQAPYRKGAAIICDWRIEFVVPYPFLLGVNSHTQDVDPETGGGFSVPMAIPLDLSIGGATNVETINNAGNGPAFPVITFYGPLENPSITNLTTLKTFQLQRTLGTSTDSVVVDFYTRTVILNESTNISEQVNGDFWTLDPGDNIIKLSAASSGLGGRAMIAWEDHYLGV